MADIEHLLALAGSARAGERQGLVDAIADLFDQTGGPISGETRALISDIFMSLVREAERALRLHMAKRLAAADWAPVELIQLLSFDDIEIARPVIAQSPLLADTDLIRLLVEATLEHQVEVAHRPNLDATVVGVILDQGQAAVVTALAGNDTAEITTLDMARLVAASRRIASARAPLARHPRLTAALAHSLYSWVGDSLKAGLAGRFEIDEALLAEEIAGAVGDAAGVHPDTQTFLQTTAQRDEMERRLVGKLQAAGELRPGYLVRSLKEGRLSLFVHALATLGGCDANEVRAAMNAAVPEPLAMACAAVGLDRSVFPTILQLVRGLNAGRPGWAATGDAAEARPAAI